MSYANIAYRVCTNNMTKGLTRAQSKESLLWVAITKTINGLKNAVLELPRPYLHYPRNRVKNGGCRIKTYLCTERIAAMQN